MPFFMTEAESKDVRVLNAHVDDLILRTDLGEVTMTSFLSPREQYIVLRYLKQIGRKDAVRFRGGYPMAERRRACFLPEYLTELLPDDDEESEAERLYLLPAYREENALLEVRASGYRELSHRDFLGSLLALGIERDVTGDILILPYEETGREQPRAYLVCDRRILPFLLEAWKKVGNEPIRISVLDGFPEGFVPERKVREINDTVASNRLDSVISSLVKTSREKAQGLIRAGAVDVDYETEDKSDRRLSPPCTISVRGKGKYTLLSVGEETKKGRLRLRAEQYV